MCSTKRLILVLSAAAMALAGLVPTAAADVKANTDSYRRINQEAWSQGKLAVVDEAVAPDYVYHEPTLGDVRGPAGLKQTIAMYRSAYPDLQFTIDDLIGEGDLVALRWLAAGTQKGALIGVPATGLKTTSVGINIARFAGGKIVEEWSSWDVMGLMQQLGAVKPPRPGPESYLWTAPSKITGEPGEPATNKLLVLRVKAQFWNGKDVGGLDVTHHANAIGHDPAFPGPPSYESYRQACLMYQVAFPDFHVNMDLVFAEGDKVVVHWVATGTQEGELMGIPASGKAVQFTGITIYRVADGKIAETWWAYDALGVVQQITSPPEWSAAGVWVLSVPTPAGNILMLHTNHANDPAGTRLGGVMWEVNGNPTHFGTFPDAEGGNHWVTRTIKIGPNTFETTMLGYATKKREDSPDELVLHDN